MDSSKKKKNFIFFKKLEKMDGRWIFFYNITYTLMLLTKGLFNVFSCCSASRSSKSGSRGSESNPLIDKEKDKIIKTIVTIKLSGKPMEEIYNNAMNLFYQLGCTLIISQFLLDIMCIWCA